MKVTTGYNEIIIADEPDELLPLIAGANRSPINTEGLKLDETN